MKYSYYILSLLLIIIICLFNRSSSYESFKNIGYRKLDIIKFLNSFKKKKLYIFPMQVMAGTLL